MGCGLWPLGSFKLAVMIQSEVGGLYKLTDIFLKLESLEVSQISNYGQISTRVRKVFLMPCIDCSIVSLMIAESV